jgi:nitrite reductase/ring-hydroxylating ferredoxin subunit
MDHAVIGDVAEKMLDYVEKGKTFMTGKTMSVPTRSYTDPVQFKAEMELIFKRVPLMLALTCEMKNPGDFKAMDVTGLPVLINRDKKVQIRAFLNVCAHRGAPVASEGHGNCPLFVCKYHGWTYGRDGRLTGVSEASKFGEIDKSAKGLRELPCEERHGLIFVCLSPGSSSISTPITARCSTIMKRSISRTGTISAARRSKAPIGRSRSTAISKAITSRRSTPIPSIRARRRT